MTRSARQEFRTELLAQLPPHYSPWLHLAVPTLGGTALIAVSLAQLRAVQGWQLALVPVFLLVGNAVEWHAHRGVLHRRTRFLEALYLRHTPMHHALYPAGEMALGEWRELRFVLLPAWAIFAIVLLTAPIAIAFALVRQPNLAALWIASATFYVLSYEWLHLTYHLPEASAPGRLRAVRFLRRHHELHHAPQLMQRWNFNVTVPIWDVVRGTRYRREAVPDEGAARHPAR